jgi:hypothetical protein
MVEKCLGVTGAFGFGVNAVDSLAAGHEQDIALHATKADIAVVWAKIE